MAREVIRCPVCKSTMSVDNQKKFTKCPMCKYRVYLDKAEVVIPPEVTEEYHGKWFNNHVFLGYFTILFGTFGIDLFIKKKVAKGIMHILLCWTGASTIISIFRAINILGLEDSEIEDFYKNYR